MAEGGAIVTAKVKGAAAQYQKSATVAGAYDSTKIHPFDSGTVLGTVPPGKLGIKQIDGTIQNATDLTSSQLAADAPGNAFHAGQDAAGDVAENAYQQASAGLSLSPEHE